MADPAQQARIVELIRAIPEGFVRTYGDIAPRTPRLVGRVLRDAEALDLPWWRVVRSDGTATQGERQLALLRAEDVPLRPGGKVDLVEARLPVPPGVD
ncbi:MAG: MGMT family protein [Patulibacter minatonensis]